MNEATYWTCQNAIRLMRNGRLRAAEAGPGSPSMPAPKMAFVDNKGKVRKRAQTDLLKQADGLDFWQWRVEDILSSLEDGKAITYACYRWAIKELSDAITSKQRAEHKPRSVRRATA